MKPLFSLAIFVAASLLAVAAPPETQRKHLDRPTVIQGYSCAKGSAWFFADGRLERCFLARETDLGGAHIPAGSILVLRPGGELSGMMLKRDTVLGGVRCSGGGALGAAEGAATGLYPSGKLKACYLAADQTVQGVPCAKSGFWTAVAGYDQAVEFYEDGMLKSCRLSRDYGGHKQGESYVEFR